MTTNGSVVVAKFLGRLLWTEEDDVKTWESNSKTCGEFGRKVIEVEGNVREWGWFRGKLFCGKEEELV